MSKLKEEQYYGNTEYKLKFTNMNVSKIERYATQLKFRLIEGKGTAYYYIGVADDGQIVGIDEKKVEFHLETMYQIANSIKGRIESIKILPVKDKSEKFIFIKIVAEFNIDDIPYIMCI